MKRFFFWLSHILLIRLQILFTPNLFNPFKKSDIIEQTSTVTVDMIIIQKKKEG